MKILTWIRCRIFSEHAWTCAAEEGQKAVIPVNPTSNEAMLAFHQYAKSYCKDCGYVNANSQKKIMEYADLVFHESIGRHDGDNK